MYSKDNKWIPHEYPQELKKLKTIFDWRDYPEELKEKWYVYIDKEFTRREEGYWFLNKGIALILLALIICTCSGPKLMLGSQTFEKQTDYSLYSGKLARQTQDVMGFATLRIDGLDLASCQAARQLIKLQSHQMLDSESYRRLVAMQRRCLPTRLYQYQRTTHSFSNQYRTEWTGQRQNLRIEFQPPNLQESPSSADRGQPEGKPRRARYNNRLEKHRR